MFWLEKYASLKNFVDAFSLFWLLTLLLNTLFGLSIYEIISPHGTLFPLIAPIVTLFFLVAFGLYKFGGQNSDYKKFVGSTSFVQMVTFGVLLGADLTLKTVGSFKGTDSKIDFSSILIAGCFMRLLVYTNSMVEAFSVTREKEETSKQEIVESLL